MHKSWIVIALSLTLVGPLAGVTNASNHDPWAPEVEDHSITSFDDVEIHFTVFRPVNATATDPTPLILHSHGWGGSRATAPSGTVSDLLDAGFGVLSIDQRGHGASGGEATIMHAAYEVRDLGAILDWAAANLDWVIAEGDPQDKDLVLGAVGGSYGGAYQLLLASHDGRLDAIVPQMAWNDLSQSLAPNGVVKSVWVDALYAAGKTQARIDPRIDDWYRQVMLTNEVPQEARDHFVGSNPIPENIEAATLLVQGVPDVLFNWNEAVRNYGGIRSGGNDDVALVGYLGGHVLPGFQPLGFMGPQRGGEPCGEYSDLAIAWFQHHLLGDTGVSIPSGISYATEQGTCITPTIAAVTPKSVGSTPAPAGAGSLLVPVDHSGGVLAGIPTVSGTYQGTTENILFFSFVVTDAESGRTHIVDDQATPQRVGPSATGSPFNVQMAGVATELDPDDRLFLRIDSLNEWYAHNGGRTPTPGQLHGLVIDTPYIA